MQTITIATMQMLETLVSCCSAKGRLALAEADLIHQLEVILNPLSLSFTETVDIHTHLMKIITNCFWILTPDGLKKLGIEEGHGEQAVSETVLKQVLIPSKTYICNLCMNRYSIVDRVLSMRFLTNLAQLIQICPYYQPLTQIVLDMPVFLTIPSCLTFFEKIDSIWLFLYSMVEIQQEWNKTRGAKRQMWTNVHRTLRMEGFADAMEAKLQYDRYTITGSYIGYSLIEWSILQGMNPPKYQ
ncbi:hypothetical protein BLNAU_4035 [Blattamonas nauphoetae]|uniref:Uncharacterized protein n=1 Tax=Blattamonas nauphoetae TaxID=2049346 RepID=A0ABQ9YAZ4_9EUKA|nr:hypothetical protein BLNAU_4035 [Blattamonas nauphoetae]